MSKGDSVLGMLGQMAQGFGDASGFTFGGEQSGPNNTTGSSSHTQAGGLFGGGSSGSSESRGKATVHRGSKGTETGETRREGNRLVHYDTGSTLFGGLDKQQTGYSQINGNRVDHFDNVGGWVGWSVCANNRIDNYDRGGNHRFTSYGAVGDAVATEQIHRSARGGTSNGYGGQSLVSMLSLGRGLLVWAGILIIGLVVVSLFNHHGRSGTKKIQPNLSTQSGSSGRANTDKPRKSIRLDAAGRVSAEPPEPLLVHRLDGTTANITTQEVARGILENRISCDESGTVRETKG